MESKKYIGLDVHQASISAAVRDDSGKARTPSERRIPLVLAIGSNTYWEAAAMESILVAG